MKEKNTLLNKIDEAIQNEATSSKDKELLKEAKEQLININTKSKKEYSDLFIKIINVIGAIAKVFTSSG